MYIEPTAEEIRSYRSYTGVGLNEAHRAMRVMRLKDAIPEAKTLTEVRDLLGHLADIAL
jgi:hypothetical protein